MRTHCSYNIVSLRLCIRGLYGGGDSGLSREAISSGRIPKCVLGLLPGPPPDEDGQNTSPARHPGGILTRCPIDLVLLDEWRSRYSPNSTQISGFLPRTLTLPLRISEGHSSQQLVFLIEVSRAFDHRLCLERTVDSAVK